MSNAALGMLLKTDVLAQARVRGLHAAAQLLQAEGGSLGSGEVAALLHMTRQGVDRRRREGKLIGLAVGRRGYRYPVWQFRTMPGGSGTLAGLEAVLAVLRDRDPWMRAAFMLNHNTRLNGRAPLEVLQAGEVDAVLDAAHAYGEQGAS